MSPYMYLRSVVDSGELGKPVHVDMKRISSTPLWSWENWMCDTKKSGGTPIDLSIHDLDFARDTFGEPKTVSGIYQRLNENKDDYIVSNLVYDDFSVTATGAWYGNGLVEFNASYLAVFERGAVELKGGKVYKNGKEVDLAVKQEEVSENTGINISRADGYAGEIAYFVDCITRGVPADRVTPESSEESVRLVEKILANSIII